MDNYFARLLLSMGNHFHKITFILSNRATHRRHISEVIANANICSEWLSVQLILHPLRWTTYARTKLDTFIEFPLNGLDMSSYLLNNLSGTRSDIQWRNVKFIQVEAQEYTPVSSVNL